MAAFDRIRCGFPELDEILDYIRLGDNVVWQVTDIGEFSMFARPFVRQAVEDGRDVTYVRFAQHDPLIEDLTGVHLLELNPDIGFEAFTVALYEEITHRGREAIYVFDCLSELQSVWYTDLMMGNFFCVICPYLFELDTVAYFPLLRGRHSFDAIARIRNTTQLLLDVCTNEDDVYLRPLKVWNRNSERMFLPHGYSKKNGRFFTIGNGVRISQYYQLMQEISEKSQNQEVDSYDRFFEMARAAYRSGNFLPEMEEQIIDSTMTKDEKLKELVRRYFTPADYFRLRRRMIGSGAIGGKACGMLLARKIAETEIPEFRAYSEPHDSFYIGSDVFYTYLVSNGDWRLRIRQRTKEGYFNAAGELREHILKGKFPVKIRDKFWSILECFGQSPFIVRSSSFLEDGFGNAFAGKYESVFCANQGSPQERMEEFENAVRTVYASTMDYSALEYRLQRGLERKDEQMAVLVQRVSGTYYGKYYMPGAAGVGYSHSAYKWQPDMDSDAGMLRLVIGLGTKAVDRTEEDYPRLVNLDRPAVTRTADISEKHRFSQRRVDVIDCEQNSFCELPLMRLLDVLPLWYQKLVLEHDTDAERLLRERGQRREVLFISCQRLLENRTFTGLMQKLLKTLQRVYGTPVDIEYAINMDERGNFVVNLLQCRPLYVGQDGGRISLDDVKPEKVLFDVVDSSMSGSGVRRIDVVVSVDPVKYYEYPYRSKYEVAKAIGYVNRHYRGSGKKLMLMTPGRIGTSSPELGVPVKFGEISNFSVICEISDSRAGYNPELSYGSHMFQDLVESEIGYVAILNNGKTLRYDAEMLNGLPDLFEEICPDAADGLKDMITVKETEHLTFWHDAVENHSVCGIPRSEE